MDKDTNTVEKKTKKGRFEKGSDEAKMFMKALREKKASKNLEQNKDPIK